MVAKEKRVHQVHRETMEQLAVSVSHKELNTEIFSLSLILEPGRSGYPGATGLRGDVGAPGPNVNSAKVFTC